MHDIDTHELAELGDAVVESKDSAMTGTVDRLVGFRHSAGFSSED